MLQVSMDEPNVSWKLYDSIVQEWSENDDYPDLIDIGSCSLHVVHGAFRTGMQKTKWGIDGILKHCTTCFLTQQQKGKTTKRFQDLKCFHYHSVEPDGLKIRK